MGRTSAYTRKQLTWFSSRMTKADHLGARSDDLADLDRRAVIRQVVTGQGRYFGLSDYVECYREEFIVAVTKRDKRLKARRRLSIRRH